MINILTALTLLTTFVAATMALFGQVPKDASLRISGNLYERIKPMGFMLPVFCAIVLYYT